MLSVPNLKAVSGVAKSGWLLLLKSCPKKNAENNVDRSSFRAP